MLPHFHYNYLTHIPLVYLGVAYAYIFPPKVLNRKGGSIGSSGSTHQSATEARQ